MAFLALFESNAVSKIFLAIILTIFAVAVSRLLKKRVMISTSERQVFLLMFLFAIIYLALFYVLGFYFGLSKSTVRFGIKAITTFILPISIIIISSEYIRSILIAQKGKLNSFLVLISMVLVDIIVYTQVYNLREYNDFLAVVGFVTFASISCNLLYNYLSIRYGYKPIIVYRLLTVLYCYIIPYVPNVYMFMRSIFRMVFPYIIYLVIDNAYSKNNKVNTLKEKKKNFISTSVLFFVAGIIAYLVSCQFTFGMFVVGSGSMTGTINKGDAIVFQKLGDHEIKENEVIVFKKNNFIIVHRVINIQIINGEERYFTKGDANDVEDDMYVTRKDIVGRSLFRIKYIGYPTLWLRSLFIEIEKKGRSIMKRRQVDSILFDQAKRKKKIFDYSCIIIILLFTAFIFFYLFMYFNKPEYVTYNEKSDLDYKVYLKDNPFIKDKYSKSDNQYIASMIDFVRADFSYNLSASRDVEFQYSYKIVANINVSDNNTHKSLYKYSEDLVNVDYVSSSGSKITLNKSVDIDYNRYNDLIKRFVGVYDLDGADSSLDVSMYVNVRGNCDPDNSTSNQSVTTLSIPLTAKTFAIDMAYNVVDSDNEKIMLCNDDVTKCRFLLVIGFVLVAFAIKEVFTLVRYIIITRTAETIYDRELKKILNNYKSYIQKVETGLEFTGYKIIKIETFTDMLEIRDTIQEPILMVENINKNGVNFYIPGKSRMVYCYSLRVSDIKFKIAKKGEK